MSGFLKSPLNYRKQAPSPQTGFRGLGDDTAAGGDTPSFDWSFASGSALTAFVLGIGFIIAVKTVLAPSRGSAPKKKWAAGAWRDLDYEDPSAPLFSDKELKRLLRNNRGNRARAVRRRRRSKYGR